MSFARIALLFIVSIFIFGGVSSPAFSEDAATVSKGTSIAVVDVQVLMKESKAAKNIKEQGEKIQAKFLKEVEGKEEELRERQKTLIDQRASLSPEEYSKKGKEYEQEWIKARNFATERKKALDKAAVVSLNKLRDEIFKVVQEISNEKGYDLVISKQNVVLGANSINITEETLKRLDKAVKSIPLDVQSN